VSRRSYRSEFDSSGAAGKTRLGATMAASATQFTPPPAIMSLTFSSSILPSHPFSRISLLPPATALFLGISQILSYMERPALSTVQSNSNIGTVKCTENPFLNCGLNTYLTIVDVPANPSSVMGFFTGGIVVRENVSFFLLFFFFVFQSRPLPGVSLFLFL